MHHNKKILHVEDNAADVALTKVALEELNILSEHIHLADGQELINYLKANSFQDIGIILLDLNMPKMSGLEVLKFFYKDNELKKLPVVVFSSSDQEIDVRSCYDFGANAYVRKPINYNDYNRTLSAIARFWLEANVFPVFD
ncbi:MAG: response regulator [Saprospiraceae bacterium]